MEPAFGQPLPIAPPRQIGAAVNRGHQRQTENGQQKKSLRIAATSPNMDPAIAPLWPAVWHSPVRERKATAATPPSSNSRIAPMNSYMPIRAKRPRPHAR